MNTQIRLTACVPLFVWSRIYAESFMTNQKKQVRSTYVSLYSIIIQMNTGLSSCIKVYTDMSWNWSIITAFKYMIVWQIKKSKCDPTISSSCFQLGDSNYKGYHIYITARYVSCFDLHLEQLSSELDTYDKHVFSVDHASKLWTFFIISASFLLFNAFTSISIKSFEKNSSHIQRKHAYHMYQVQMTIEF
jgi:hypothetical protein